LPIETQRYKSLRIVAVLRLLGAMSDEELSRELARPIGVLDPGTMNDGDLETLLDELCRRRSHQTG
jgi:hypothetical protein